MNASLERREAGDGMRPTQATGWLSDHSSRIVTTGIVLAILYLGRSVLIPIVLAVMLSLFVAPLVRALRRLRVGRTMSVLVAVVALTVSCMAVAATLGTQALRIAESLPQYESNVQRKLKTLEEVVIGPILTLTNETSRLVETRESTEATLHVGGVSPPASGGADAVLSGSLELGRHPLRLMVKLLTTVWGPIQFAGIVLLVLIFVLLEHESLRDRLIRTAGATDIRSATLALNDAGDRLSRYFVSQFLVNLAFGLAIWVSLSILSLPQALLCGMLAGVMRFVPYVGVAISRGFFRRPCIGRRSRMVSGAHHIVCVHPAGHRRGTIGGTASLRTRNGPIAAGCSGRSDILELPLGSGRADSVHTPHLVSPGCWAAHEGAQCARGAIGQRATADVAAKGLPTSAVRRPSRDHRRRAHVSEE